MQCKPVKCNCSAHKWSSRKHQKIVVSLCWLCVWPGEERPGGKVSDGRKVKKNELRQAQKLVKKQQRGREPAVPTCSLLASGLMLLTLVALCMSFAVEQHSTSSVLWGFGSYWHLLHAPKVLRHSMCTVSLRVLERPWLMKTPLQGIGSPWKICQN